MRSTPIQGYSLCSAFSMCWASAIHWSTSARSCALVSGSRARFGNCRHSSAFCRQRSALSCILAGESTGSLVSSAHPHRLGRAPAMEGKKDGGNGCCALPLPAAPTRPRQGTSSALRLSRHAYRSGDGMVESQPISSQMPATPSATATALTRSTMMASRDFRSEGRKAPTVVCASPRKNPGSFAPIGVEFAARLNGC